MFWSKSKYIDDRLGEFKYSSGCWHAELNCITLGEISISLEGCKTKPDQLCLEAAKNISSKLNEYVEAAKIFISLRVEEDFTKGSGKLVFNGFHCRKNSDLVDLDFGFFKLG